MDGGFTASPDGQWVYMSAGNCNFSQIIYRLHLTSPQVIDRLSPPGGNECFELVNKWPSISPDGTRIAFQSHTDIWIMNADGSGQTNLTNSSSIIDSHPSWSPDGRIAFSSERSGSPKLFVMNADGSSLAGLTTPPTGSWDSAPTWQR